MSKDEFLNTLDRRLQLINEKERRDIIDEYRTHIEMKVQDGKSEEEAIDDFGNMDELVDEILDAYKINTSRANQNFDRKFNSFMDSMYEGFKRFIGSFTSLEVDDVVKLVFEILVILVILTILHIPFSIVASLGSSLLRSIIGLGIGHLLGGIWKIVIELAYVVVFIVIIVNVVMKRVNRYRNPNDFRNDSTVFDDFKESFNFDQAKENIHSMNNRQPHTRKERSTQQSQEFQAEFYEDLDKKNEQDIESESMQNEEEANKRRNGYESREDRMRQRGTTQSRVGESVTGVFRILMRIFYCLLLMPFIGIIVALCCALGAMVVLSIQGFTLVGAYFIIIGGLFVTGAFLSLLHDVLWRKGESL